MNKNESKYYSTATLFDEALIYLLDKKDIEYITIKEICKKAGFNRSTFYLHYEGIDDLLNESIEYATNKFIDFFNKDSNKFIENLNNTKKEDLIFINNEYLRPYLEFIKENKTIFMASFKNPIAMKSSEKYSNLEKYVLIPILYKYDNSDNSDNKKKYILKFYINGIMAIIKDWTINDCKEDIEDIINIIVECVRP